MAQHPFFASLQSRFSRRHSDADDFVARELRLVEENKKAVIEAAQAGDYERLSRILIPPYSRCIEWSFRSKEGKTMLGYAAENGLTVMIECLYEQLHADITKGGVFGKTPLHLAAENGHTGVVECLHRLGATIDDTDMDQKTALHLAAENGHTSVVECLHRLGAKIDDTDRDQKTALHLAAENGHTATVELLRQLGADVNKTDTYRMTALHKAAANGHTATVECLHRLGVDINQANEYGQTALDHAVANEQSTMVECLIRLGVDLPDNFEAFHPDYRELFIRPVNERHEAIVGAVAARLPVEGIPQLVAGFVVNTVRAAAPDPQPISVGPRICSIL
jgi:hypothetical protein